MSEKLRIGDVVIDLGRVAGMTPGERLQFRELMNALTELRRVNPLEFYRPNGPKYHEFHMAKQRGVKLLAFLGGNRSGKTTTALVDDIIQMTPPELLPAHLAAYKTHPGCPYYCRVMTPDMERTMKPVIHHKLQQWLPQPMIPKGWAKHYDSKAQCVYLECGCRFDFLSYEMDLDKFGGVGVHRCHYDEEPPLNIREECLFRLADFDGDELFSMTPLKGLSWAYRTIKKNADHPKVHLAQVSLRDNPNIPTESIDRIVDEAIGISATAAAMRVEGLFTPEHGLVYPEVRQWLTPRPPPDAIRASDVLVGIDPGIRKCGLTWTAHDGDRFVTFDARELKNATVRDYVGEIRRTNRRWGIAEDQLSYIIDPNARARSLTNAESVESELNRMEIYPEHGQNNIEVGVLMLTRLGREGLWLISEDLEEFIEKLEDYPLEEWQDGTLHPAKNGEEHMADAVRYAIASRAWPRAEEERAAAPLWGDDVARAPDPVRRARVESALGPMV